MFERDPKQLFDRYGRQLLVQGVQFEGQQVLHRLAAVVGCDGSPLAQAAGQVAARYLVGAGVGRAVVPQGWGTHLQALDPLLQLAELPSEAQPPVVQLWFAARAYGASADVVWTDSSGQDLPQVRAGALQWWVGGTAPLTDAVALGAAVADLVVAEALGVEPLPSLVVLDFSDPLAPRTHKHAAAAGPPLALPADPGSPLQELARKLSKTLQVQQIVAQESARCYPAEACGLVVADAEGQLLAVPVANLQDRWHAQDPEAFSRSARTAFALDERAIAAQQRLGRRLVAIWHSHCDVGADFSAADLRGAYPDGQALYPGVVHWVVSVRRGCVAEQRVCALDAGQLRFAVVAAGGELAERQRVEGR